MHGIDKYDSQEGKSHMSTTFLNESLPVIYPIGILNMKPFIVIDLEFDIHLNRLNHCVLVLNG